MKKILVISSEHGVNSIPEAYASLFEAHQALLNSHRGIDFGSLRLARALHQALPSDFIQANASRLLIDCNRNLKHPACFSEITKPLPQAFKNAIIQKYYLPYRNRVEQIIQAHLDKNCLVWHLSIHSFTPILNGEQRRGEIGLLYDPKSTSENPFAKALKQQIRKQDASFHLRMNYPYKGVSDGFTTTLRKKHPASQYLGLEIEVNQRLVADETRFRRLQEVFLRSLRILLDE